jgi:AraC-like DNA-binding protein
MRDSGAPDLELSRVLQAVHGDPALAWTVPAMAAVAGLSTSAFARRFAGQMRETPMAYLVRLRMGRAEEALMRPGATLASVAPQIGYGNEFAFSHAFKRHHGTAPGRWRTGRRARVDGAPPPSRPVPDGTAGCRP